MTTSSNSSAALAVGHDVDVGGVPGDGGDRGAHADAVGEGRRERLDVARRAARDRRPLRAPGEREHPVVGEEGDQEARREGPHLLGVGRPHGGGLGHEQALDEPAREALVVQEGAQRALVAGVGEQGARRAVEAHVVGHHAQEARPREVRRLGDQPARAARGVLEVLVLRADREAHVGRLARDAELVEQRLEARVVAVVEDDEAGVDVPCGVVGVDADRVRVPADVIAGLVDDDLVLGVQQMGSRQARDARPDDRDPHDIGVRTPVALRINRWRAPTRRRRGRSRPRARWWRPVRCAGCRRRRPGWRCRRRCRPGRRRPATGADRRRAPPPEGEAGADHEVPSAQRAAEHARRRAAAPTQLRAIGAGAASSATPDEGAARAERDREAGRPHRATLAAPSTVHVP